MSNGNSGGGCVEVIGVLLLFAVVGMLLPKSDAPTSSSGGRARVPTQVRQEGGDESGAWSAARAFVENRLKNPASADFPWYDGDAIQFLGNDRYRISSYVDAGNSFGGTIRTNYNCTVRNDGGSWTLENMSMR